LSKGKKRKRIENGLEIEGSGSVVSGVKEESKDGGEEKKGKEGPLSLFGTIASRVIF
jgi:hypothetical protein